MAGQRRVARLGYTLALGVAPRGRLVQAGLGVRPQGGHGRSKRQELRGGVAHPLHQDVPVPAALAATAPHDFVQRLLAWLGWTREDRGAAAARRRAVFDARKGGFCALYRVVASVPRGLPSPVGYARDCLCQIWAVLPYGLS